MIEAWTRVRRIRCRLARRSMKWKLSPSPIAVALQKRSAYRAFGHPTKRGVPRHHLRPGSWSQVVQGSLEVEKIMTLRGSLLTDASRWVITAGRMFAQSGHRHAPRHLEGEISVLREGVKLFRVPADTPSDEAALHDLQMREAIHVSGVRWERNVRKVSTGSEGPNAAADPAWRPEVPQPVRQDVAEPGLKVRETRRVELADLP